MVRIEHFELRTPDVVALRLPAGAVVRVGTGRLWLTQEGRSEDVWLQAHGSWTAPQAVSVRLSAEPSVDFQIAQPAAVRRAPRIRLTRPGLDMAGAVGAA
ncbi:DUF2917 domain-containing protein [Rhodoferax sp. WC2427]|uniref:DUF2917 domain-containing protein n=1 Tax=Rhodoferax sp. WC2427 TaxID=3234144 RepID=UPI003466AAF7